MRTRSRATSRSPAQSAARSLLAAAVSTSGLTAIYTVLLLVTTILLARWLGPEQYGIYALVTAVAVIVGHFATPGTENVLIRDVASYGVAGRYGASRGLLGFATRIAVIGSVILVLLVVTATWAYRSFAFDPVTQAMLVGALIIPINALSRVRAAALVGLHQVVLARVPELVVRPVVLLVVVALAVWIGTGSTAVVGLALTCVAYAASFVVGAVLLRRAMPRPMREAPREYDYARWTRSMPSFLALGFSDVLASQLSITLIGTFGTARDAGVFAVANRGAAVVALGFAGVAAVAAPRIALLWAQRGPARPRRPAQAVRAALRGRGSTGGRRHRRVARPAAVAVRPRLRQRGGRTRDPVDRPAGLRHHRHPGDRPAHDRWRAAGRLHPGGHVGVDHRPQRPAHPVNGRERRRRGLDDQYGPRTAADHRVLAASPPLDPFRGHGGRGREEPGMCGVAALVAAPRHRWTTAQLETMRRCLHHRGPDASGVYSWPAGDASSQDFVVGLAHTRLSILDVSHGSDQPMSDADSAVSLTFNGEIYNYIELRQELQQAGHSFSTTGDTEVLLRAYLQWGTACLPKLVGMYAFVVHDPRSRTVLAARDPYGIKPLYLAESSAGIAMASELKAFSHLETVSGAVSQDALFRYLRFASARPPTRRSSPAFTR